MLKKHINISDKETQLQLSAIFIGIVILFSILILVFYRPAETYNRDFEEYLDQTAKIKSFSANFNTTYYYTINNVTYVNEETGYLVSKDGKKRKDVLIRTADNKTLPISVYLYNKIAHMCLQYQNQWYCQPIRSPNLNSSMITTIFKNIYNKGALIFYKNLSISTNEKLINNITCKLINADIKTEILNNEEKLFIIEITSGDILYNYLQTTPQALINALGYANFSICNDNGLPLKSSWTLFFEKPKPSLFQIDTYLYNVTTEKQIDEDYLELPKNYKQLSELDIEKKK